MERLVTLADSQQLLQPEHLAPKFHRAARPARTTAAAPASLRAAVEHLEKEMIAAALARHHGNKSGVARELGLSRLGLQNKIDRLGIATKQNKHGE